MKKIKYHILTLLYFLKNKPSKLTPFNILRYIKGYVRLYFLNYEFFLSEHIREQFFTRMTLMNNKCLVNKECPCECTCPAKQLSDESCELNCYPVFVCKEEWDLLKQQDITIADKIKAGQLIFLETFCNEN